MVSAERDAASKQAGAPKRKRHWRCTLPLEPLLRRVTGSGHGLHPGSHHLAHRERPGPHRGTDGTAAAADRPWNDDAERTRGQLPQAHTRQRDLRLHEDGRMESRRRDSEERRGGRRRLRGWRARTTSYVWRLQCSSPDALSLNCFVVEPTRETRSRRTSGVAHGVGSTHARVATTPIGFVAQKGSRKVVKQAASCESAAPLRRRVAR